MKTTATLSLVCAMILSCHAENVNQPDTKRCLRQKATNVFNFTFADSDREANLRNFAVLFPRGTSVDQATALLSKLAAGREDCRLTAGFESLADGTLAKTFSIWCSGPSEGSKTSLDILFYFKDEKLARIDYGMGTVSGDGSND